MRTGVDERERVSRRTNGSAPRNDVWAPRYLSPTRRRGRDNDHSGFDPDYLPKRRSSVTLFQVPMVLPWPRYRT